MIKFVHILLILFIGLKLANQIPSRYEVNFLIGIVFLDLLMQVESYRRKVTHDPQSQTILQSVAM